jgi:hypothetical protein
MKVHSRCCRSTPRCASCPVLAVRAVRRTATTGQPAALFDEIYRGRAAALPAAVADALVALALARSRRDMVSHARP